jgi:hypothetical protein
VPCWLRVPHRWHRRPNRLPARPILEHGGQRSWTALPELRRWHIPKRVVACHRMRAVRRWARWTCGCCRGRRLLPRPDLVRAVLCGHRRCDHPAHAWRSGRRSDHAGSVGARAQAQAQGGGVKAKAACDPAKCVISGDARASLTTVPLCIDCRALRTTITHWRGLRGRRPSRHAARAYLN